MEILFLILLFMSAYSYLVYPTVLFVMSKILRNLWTQQHDMKPYVSIIISAYNEELVIKEKILNTLALDYPNELLEIIVNSDGSTDRTNEIVSRFEDPRLVLRVYERLGKTVCLNRTVPDAKGDIILFTDANSMFETNLLTKVVRNFTNPDIGLVTGWTKYRSREAGQETTGIYSKLERMTKLWESQISSCVGADGAIFAIKKVLYRPLEDHDINNFVIPLHVIKQGKRVVIDPEVFCFEEPSKGVKREFRRQVRITTRTLNAIRNNIEFISPFKYGFFSFFLLSHKVLRFAVPFFFSGVFVTNIFIMGNRPLLYGIIFLGQLLFFTGGILSIYGKVNGRIYSFCNVFLITLAAQLVGWFRMLLGMSDTMWTPQRQ